MKELVVLTEEPSMVPVVKAIIGKASPPISVKIIPHQGARDLESSLVRKLRAWRNPGARFLVLRDNDGADCVERKRRLAELVAKSGCAAPCKVRIVCQELEAWFVGDPEALVEAGLVDCIPSAASFRGDPDALADPVAVLKKVCGPYAKISNASLIAPYLDLDRNRSASFRETVAAIRELCS